MPPSSTGLYIVFEGADLKRLQRAISAAPIAAVLFEPAKGQELEPQSLKPLVAHAQSMGIAALVPPGGGLMLDAAADGVHVLWSADVAGRYLAARLEAAPPLLAGADAGRSRHDAMLIGEAGADYVGFGVPPHVEDRARARERRLELVTWWAEIFEIPVVAFDVEEPGEAAELAASGADFISLRLPAELTDADAEARVKAFAAAISGPQSAASEGR